MRFPFASPSSAGAASAQVVVAGVDIGGTRLRLRLADLQGIELGAWSTLLGENEKTPKAVCRRLAHGLDLCCHDSGVTRSKLIHLTAGAPGITDSRSGIVIAAPNLTQWSNVPLRELLEQEIGLPVAVDNDVNLAALGEYHASAVNKEHDEQHDGEHHEGEARGVAAFVFLALGTGLGCGIVLHGRIHAGAQWSAGEVGYLHPRNRPRKPPRLSHTGSLEEVVGGSGVEQRWRQALLARAITDQDLHARRALQVFDRVAEGDLAAAEVLQATATLLADAITDIALVLDPELVILGGGLGSHPALCPAVEACLAANELARPRLRSSLLGANAQLAGAVAFSLAQVRSNPRR